MIHASGYSTFDFLKKASIFFWPPSCLELPTPPRVRLRLFRWSLLFTVMIVIRKCRSGNDEFWLFTFGFEVTGGCVQSLLKLAATAHSCHIFSCKYPVLDQPPRCSKGVEALLPTDRAGPKATFCCGNSFKRDFHRYDRMIPCETMQTTDSASEASP